MFVSKKSVLILSIIVISFVNSDQLTNFEIIGGKIVNEELQKSLCPHSIAVRFHDDMGVCSGFILNSTNVMTAAHCIITAAENIFIRAGCIDANYGGVVRNISKITIHPEYTKGKVDSVADIAILEMNEPLEFGETITSRRTANSNDNYIYEKIGANISVCAFGFSEVGFYKLHYIELPILSNVKCYNDYEPDDIITDKHTCIGNITRRYLESGDSGGEYHLCT